MSNAALEPFPGPRAFEPEEERLFCGRDEEKNDLRDLIQTYSVVLLYSQSGAGKTSLLQAGLQPALRKDGIETLTARVGRATDRERGSPSGNIYVHSALGNSCDGTPTLKERFARKSGTRHVVVFDQFEELFTAFPERWRERKDLFLQVADAVQEDSELRVLLVPREEYLGQLEHYAGLLPFDLQIRYRLERLREEAALSAIEEPLKNFNCLIDPSSARRLIENLRKVRVRVGKEVRELDGEFIEPVHLQVVCRDLWRRRDPQGNTIAVSDKLDGVDEALRGFYESGVDRASRESRVSERVIRNWFENSVITASGTRRVLFKEEDSTDGLPNTTVAILEEERVIRSEPRASEQTCELAHDRLIGPIKTSNRACRARRRWVVWPVSALVLAVGAYSAYKMVRRILDLRVTERLLKQLPEDEAQGYSDLRYAETKEADAAVYRYQASEPSRHGPSGVDQAEARRKSQELEKDAENHYSNALRHYKSAISIYEALYRRGRIPGDEAAGVFTSLATLGKTGGNQNEIHQILEQESKPDSALWNAATKAQIYVARGEIEYQEGNTKEVVRLYGEAQTSKGLITPESLVQFDEDMGLAQLRMGDFDNAQKTFTEALSLASVPQGFGRRFELFFDLGLVASQRGLYQTASEIFTALSLEKRFSYEKAVRDTPRLLRETGYVQLHMKRFQTAQTSLELAYNHSASSTYQRALVCMTLSEFQMEAPKPDLKTAVLWAGQAIALLANSGDMVMMGSALAYKTRTHSLEAELRVPDTVNKDCNGLELKCAEKELTEAEGKWKNADYKIGEAYNYTTHGLIEKVRGNGEAAIKQFQAADCIYTTIQSQSLHKNEVENYLRELHGALAQPGCSPSIAKAGE